MQYPPVSGVNHISGLTLITCYVQGRIQDFKLGGVHLKKLHRAEGSAKFVGVFRVKNHDFMPKNYIFSNFRGGAGSAPDVYNVSVYFRIIIYSRETFTMIRRPPFISF